MNKSRLLILPTAILAVALFCGGAFVRQHYAKADGPKGVLWAGLSRPFGGGGGGAEPVEVFDTVLQSLQTEYVDKITDPKKLTYGAIESMVASLHDPYSMFLTPERRKALDEAEQGRFHGLGAIVLPQRTKYKDVTYERLTVANVLPGSPAEKAGLQPGDVIQKVNGKFFFQIPDDILAEDLDPETLKELLPAAKDIEEKGFLSYKEAMETLSPDGKTVTLAVLHPGQTKPVDLKVALGPTTVPAVESRMLQPGVGYLAVRGFMRNSPAEVQRAMDQLQQQGAKSLVLDLRNSFGGPLVETTKVAGQFMGGTLAHVIRQKSAKSPVMAEGKTRFDGKIVVLVNRATLGTSELLAAALAEQVKAPVVGATTFGDGLDQTLIPLEDGSAIQLTTGKFLTSAGVDFNAKGIKPTHPVAGTPEKQLEAALALAKSAGGAGA
ncbi:MAG: PDZ domain-containing protein [Armatimonadetes bacterium]|nr:PDZ domain-containing protein [Armatimonadota bacterium]